MTKTRNKIIAVSAAITLLFTWILSLDLLRPIWANEVATPVVDDVNHFSLTFGWPGTSDIEGGTISSSISVSSLSSTSTASYNTTSVGTLRMAYNASGYEGEYAAGALNIVLKTPFIIGKIGVNLKPTETKYEFYQKSSELNTDTGVYTYVFANRTPLVGDVFDGYIDAELKTSLGLLEQYRNIDNFYDKQEVDAAFEEPYAISCALKSDTNNINLVAEDIYVKINPLENYNAAYFLKINSPYQVPKAEYTKTIINGKVGITYDLLFGKTGGWYPIEYTDYIAIIPKYGDIQEASEGFYELPTDHPFYQTYIDSYSANNNAYVFSTEKLAETPELNVMYSTEHKNTDQPITVVIYNFHDAEKTQIYSTTQRTFTGHIGDFVTQGPVEGDHNIYPNLYQHTTIRNLGVYSSRDDDYEIPDDFENARRNGLYQNAEIYEAIAPQQCYFMGIHDSIDVPDNDASILTINSDISNLNVLGSGLKAFVDEQGDPISVLSQQDYTALGEEEKTAFDDGGNNVIIPNDVFASSTTNLYVHVKNGTEDEISQINYEKYKDAYSEVSLVKIASNASLGEIIELYNRATAEKQNGEQQYILAAYICNSLTANATSSISNDLFYFPIYNIYICSDNGEYSLVAETPIPENIHNSNTYWLPAGPRTCSADNCVYHTYSNEFIPVFAVLSSNDITQQNPNEDIFDIPDFNYEPLQVGGQKDVSDSSIGALDGIRYIVRGNGTAFNEGYDTEFYSDYTQVDLIAGQPEILSEDDFEYTYIIVPGRALVHETPTSIDSDGLYNYEFTNKTEWELFVRERGEDEEYLYTDSSTCEKNPGEILTLPENIVSFRIKVHKTAAQLETARKLSATWIASPSYFEKTPWGYESTKTGYGIKIYPETLQKAESGTRKSLTSTLIAAVASWCIDENGTTLFNNRIHHKKENISLLNPTEVDSKYYEKYGEYKHVLYSSDEFERHAATVSSMISYSVNDAVNNDLTRTASLDGYIKFKASDKKDFDEGKIDSSSDEIFKLRRADNYIIINKVLGFIPSTVTLSPRSDYVLDSTRNKVGNNSNYLNSHSSIDIVDGEKLGYPGKIIIRIDTNFSDDPLVNSYATDSSDIEWRITIEGKVDAVSAIPSTEVTMLSAIDGDSIENGKYTYIPAISEANRPKNKPPYFNTVFDNEDINQNQDTSEKLFSVRNETPAMNEATMAVHKTVLLEEKSPATYDEYRIGSGRANAGEDFEMRLTISTAANIQKDIIIYDFFWDESMGSDWNPVLKSVDIPNPENYTVYYSTLPNPGEYGTDSSWTEYNKDTISQEEKAGIKSIAIVFSSEYGIPANSSVSFPITFTAPVLADEPGKLFKNVNAFVSASYNTEGVQTGLSATLVSNETDVELVNDKSLVAVRLRDADSLAPLQGGTFEIHSAADDSLVTSDTFTTAADGMSSSIKLPSGEYYATQINTIEGYSHVKDKYPFTISLSILGNKINVIEAYNKRGMVDVLIHKVDSISETPLEGAILKLTDINDENTQYQSGKTLTDGTITISVPWGDYYLEEVKTPTGYVAIEKTLVTIPASSVGNVFELNVKDPRGDTKVTLTVASAIDREVIPDATYTLFKKDGTKIGEYTTNEDGQIVIPSLEWGEYYFQSVNDPEGYIKNDEPIPFSLDANNIIVELTDLLNRHLGSVKLTKTDVDDEGKVLKGATYTLYDVNGTKYRTNLVTDENGELTVEDLPWGSYYFVEEEAPFGYSLSDKKTVININKYTASHEQSIAVTDSATSGSIMITKKVKTEELDLNIDNPSFIFHITGFADGAEKYSYYEVITFDNNCSEDNGYYVKTAVMSDLPQCEWKVEEEKVIRFAPSKISTTVNTDEDPDNNVEIGNYYAKFNLASKTLNANVIFENDNLYKEGYSAVDTKTNSFTGENKIVGILAKTDKVSYAPNETITVDDISFSYIKDDGTEEAIDSSMITTPGAADPSEGTKIIVSDIDLEYTQPGTYIHPITVKVDDNLTYETIVKIEISEYTYEKLTDTTITVTGYRGNKEIVEIPETIDGYTVTQIGSTNYKNDALENGYTNSNKNIYPLVSGGPYTKKLILPKTTKVISNNAFGYGSPFTSLEEIVIQSGTHITDICPYAFYIYPATAPSPMLARDCEKFTITIEDNASVDTLHKYAIYGYSGGNRPSTVEISFGSEKSYIEHYYQYSLSGISCPEFNFSEGTKSISEYVFNSDCNVPLVTLPYSLEYLSKYALGNGNIKEIIYKSINAYAGEYVFNSKVEKITMPFYLPNLLGVNGKTSGYPLSNCSQVAIAIDLSIMDGIEWKYTSRDKAIIGTFDSAPQVLNKLSADAAQEMLASPNIVAVESWTPSYGAGTLTIPENIESLYTIGYRSGNEAVFNIPSSSNLKEIDQLNYTTPLSFENGQIPDSIEVFNAYINPNDAVNGSFSEKSNLKYFFNIYQFSGGIDSTQLVIPSELKAGNLIYTPYNLSTVQLNCKDLKMVTPVLADISTSSDGARPNRSLINYLRYIPVPAGDETTQQATSLTYNIGNEVTNIPAYTFYNDRGVKREGFTHSLLGENLKETITNTDFYVSCDTISIPNSTLHIGVSAFENISMKYITLGTGIKAIEDFAFYSNYLQRINAIGINSEKIPLDYKLQGVGEEGKMIIPDSLEYLGSRVFGPSDNISELHIGKNLKYLASDFISVTDYPALSQITIDADNDYFVCPDGKTIYNKDKSRIVFTIDSAKSIGPVTSETNHFVMNGSELIDIVNPDAILITIPDTVTKIGIGAFANVNCKKVVLPDNIKELKDYSFYNSIINSINIPKATVKIGDWAFANNLSFKDMNASFYGEGYNSYNADPKMYENFQGTKERLTNSNYKMDVDFSQATGLKTIGKGAFMSKNISGQLTIPSSVTVIDDFAFANCRNIKSVVFDEDAKLEDINFAAFLGVGVPILILRDNSEFLYEPAFSSLPSSLKKIDDFAFYETQFDSYNFENLHNLTYIGSYSICEPLLGYDSESNLRKTNARNLFDTRHIVIPEKVQYIGYGAFALTRISSNLGSSYSGKQIWDHSNLISSVYLKADNVEVASIGTFGTKVNKYGLAQYLGSIYPSEAKSGDSSFLNHFPPTYDDEISNVITIYGNSECAEALCNKYGYTYVPFIETTNKSGFKYIETEDGTLEITGVNPDLKITNSTLVVPNTINGIRVKSIADAAFDSPITRNTVKKLIVEDGIKQIGTDLFFDIGAISEQLISWGAFPGNNSRYDDHDEFFNQFSTHKEAAAALLISNNLLKETLRKNRPALINAELPQSVIQLGSPFRACFLANTNITSLTNINEFTSSFMYVGREKLSTPYVIPEGVSEIPPYWSGSINGGEIILPSTITKINNYGLSVAKTGSEIPITSNFVKKPQIVYLGDHAIGQTVNLSPDCLEKVEYFGTGNSLEGLIDSNGVLNLPESMDTIPANTFDGLTLQKLIIPDTIKYIYPGNFSKINELVFPETPYTLLSYSEELTNSSNVLKLNPKGSVLNLDKASAILCTIESYPGQELTISADQVGRIYYAANLTSITFTSKNLSFILTNRANLNRCTKLKDIYVYDEDGPTCATKNTLWLWYIPSSATVHVPAGTTDVYRAWLKDNRGHNKPDTVSIVDDITN